MRQAEAYLFLCLRDSSSICHDNAFMTQVYQHFLTADKHNLGVTLTVWLTSFSSQVVVAVRCFIKSGNGVPEHAKTAVAAVQPTSTT